MISQSRIAFTALVALVAGIAAPTWAYAVTTPAIRTSPANAVPACVTTARLDAFLNDQIRKRGYRLSAGHGNIARWYKKHGEAHRVRWDYAFFQMALETNFLSFRRGNGKRGDVHPRQNNFAGLGTTGGGVPGDSYPNASTGVLAQIQHLVVYSGESLARPVGHRTRLKQHVILQSVKKIVQRRPVQFADLAGRWAADKRYGRSISRLANLFYSEHCRGTQQAVRRTQTVQQARTVQQTKPVRTRIAAPTPVQAPKTKSQVSAAAFLAAPKSKAKPKPAKTEPPQRGKNRIARVAMAAAITRSPPTELKGQSAAPIPRPQNQTAATPTGAPAKTCRIQVASYGGTRAVLIESATRDAVSLTALNVQPGFEEMMTQSFIQSHAPSGKALGTFPDRSAAVAKAQALCRARTAKLGQ